MKAAVCTAYGAPDVLQVQDVAKPSPKNDEVLIKIHATAVTASDGIVRGVTLPIWHPLGFLMRMVLGFSRPRNPILGMVFAGDVEAIGSDVTRFQVGDQVFGFAGTRFGCYAQYVCLPEVDTVHSIGKIPGMMSLKPPSMTYEEAAAVVYGISVSSGFLRNSAIKPGQQVLIYGASGSMGTTAIQLMKHHYQAHVTAICSAANADLVRSLGADEVIDYTTQNEVPAGQRYDLVFDAVGKKKTSALKTACQNALTPDGQYISIDGGTPIPAIEDLLLVYDLIEAGKFKAVIDRCYPLDQIADAHRYVDLGHKKGNVMITIPQD